MGINYRSEPMRERLKKHEDPAYIFSSYVHGDPATPILETYPGDEMMIRLIDGAHEEQHVFNITGMSWRKEPADERSPLAASQTTGVSEAFNINIKEAYQPGDYLYYFGGIDDAWLGLWGIIRAYDRYQKCLKPFCKGKDMIMPLPPCPGRDDVVRRYEVAAVQTELIYNRYGDHDPDGLIFVPLEDVDLVLAGKYTPKPLILRANVGDWIEVTLHNLWDPATPVYKAYSGDRVIFRTMMPADKPRNVSLVVHGHLWREQPEDALSRGIPIQGGISIGNRFDMELKDGAACPGDYLYRSGSFGWDVESGMWGIFRVMKQSIRCRCKEFCGRIFKGRK